MSDEATPKPDKKTDKTPKPRDAISGRREWSLFPKTLAYCVEPVTLPVMKKQGLAGIRIITDWPIIVGASLAQRCIPEELNFPRGKKSGGTLSIAVESGFAPQLQHEIPVIIERLANYFGYKAVARITISHSYAAVKAKSMLPPPQPPLQRTGASAIPAALPEEVTDPELRAALESIRRTLGGA
jgi:hypothetical protein